MGGSEGDEGKVSMVRIPLPEMETQVRLRFGGLGEAIGICKVSEVVFRFVPERFATRYFNLADNEHMTLAAVVKSREQSHKAVHDGFYGIKSKFVDGA